MSEFAVAGVEGRTGRRAVPVTAALGLLPIVEVGVHRSGGWLADGATGERVVVDAERHDALMEVWLGLVQDVRAIDAEHYRRAAPVRAEIRAARALRAIGGAR